MRRPNKLKCHSSNPKHTCFAFFDSKGAHCGVITLETQQVKDFLDWDWDGDIDWNGYDYNDQEGVIKA